MKLSKLLIVLYLTAVSLLSACAGKLQVSDIGPTVTLPASQDCYRVRVISHQKTRIPKKECDELKKRAVFLIQDDWQRQRYDIQKNCQLTQCKQLVGAMDALFQAIDIGLKKTQ